nr:reverse transcriptase domain-containing protein [Tanacetum cinerariifolium]
MIKQLHINITLADALILIPKYQKMLKALLSNKEKLLELANTPLNENCSAVILKKLPKKLGDPRKFLILCGFSELKCKSLANLGASINLMPLSVWKKLGLPELISTRMTLELANRAICTPDGIVRDVFVLVGKFTFPSDFVIVDYEKLFTKNHQTGNSTSSFHPKLTSPEVKDDVFNPDLMLKPLFPSPIPVEDSGSFLEKSDTSLSYSYISLPEYETFIIHTEETNSGSTTILVDYSLPKYDSFLFEIEPDQGKLTNTFNFNIEEKNSGSTTIHADISLPNLKCLKFDFKPDPCEMTCIVDSEIHKNVPSATNVNLPPEKDHYPLFAYVVWIFLFFLMYPAIPPNLLSFGNEDTIFDPGITNYHFPSLFPDVSHRCETFMKFNVYPKLLNESSMKILSSPCYPME